MVVYKYPIPLEEKFAIKMPRGAKLLHVEVQRYVSPDSYAVMLWALVDTAEPIVERAFRLVGTGHEFFEACEHVGTVQLYGGTLVLHLFDLGYGG